MLLREQMQKLVDDVDGSAGGIKYIGYAAPGRATTDPYWIIYRQTIGSEDTEEIYPIGPKGHPCSAEKFKWSDRATLTYSTVLEASAGVLSTVTMASNNGTTTLAKVGDVATLTIVGNKYMREPTVTIAGRAAVCTIGGDSKTWTAAITLVEGDTEGLLPFTIQAYELGGRLLTPVTALTSGSGVTFDKTLPTILSVERVTDTTVKVTLSELAKTASITKANAG